MLYNIVITPNTYKLQLPEKLGELSGWKRPHHIEDAGVRRQNTIR